VGAERLAPANLSLFRVVRPTSGAHAAVEALADVGHELGQAYAARDGAARGDQAVPNILIMPTPLRHRPGRYREMLDEAGFTPIDPPGRAKLTEDDLCVALPESDALLAWGAPITAAMMAQAPRLRAIARAGAGLDGVDIAAASARGIVVSNTPGANAESVAEHVFALLLALARNVMVNDRLVRAGRWQRTEARPLRGTTLGIVGLGQSGRAVAHRGLAFGMRVLASTRAGREHAPEPGICRVSLDQLLAESDVVSIHLPLTDATRALFDRRAFGRMPRGAILINTARGGLVVEDHLVESLTSGHLAGAGLDVLAAEPPPADHPLLALGNVVFSPHIGGIDSSALDEMAARAAQCVIDLYQGIWPEDCIINSELQRGWHWFESPAHSPDRAGALKIGSHP
jgi:phosphoglycerate dehydrogenase-like enzyme